VRLQRSEGISLVGKDSAPASVEELYENMRFVTDFERNNTYPTSPASALREMVVAQGMKAVLKFRQIVFTLTIVHGDVYRRESGCRWARCRR
jgi:hypothetical protein